MTPEEKKKAKAAAGEKRKLAKDKKAAEAHESPPAVFDAGSEPGENVIHEVPEDDDEPDLDEVEAMLPKGAKQMSGKPSGDEGPELANNGKPLIAQTQIQLSRKGTKERKLLKKGAEIPKGWMSPDKIAEFIREKPQIISTKKVKTEGSSLLGY